MSSLTHPPGLLIWSGLCVVWSQALLTVMRYMASHGQLEYSRFIDFILEPEDYKVPPTRGRLHG